MIRVLETQRAGCLLAQRVPEYPQESDIAIRQRPWWLLQQKVELAGLAAGAEGGIWSGELTRR